MTTETKLRHTPGPWKAYFSDLKYGRRGWNVGGKVDRICSVENLGDPTYAETNARLIAAAPDLLRACQMVMEWASTPGDHGGNPYCKPFVREAEKAIAKATGEEVGR